MSVDLTTQVSSSVAALEKEFNAIAHNLANVNTVGYKRLVSTFARMLAEQQGIGSGSEEELPQLDLSVDFSQGLSFIETGRTLDFALYGKGFFVVETPDGPVYTRGGMFHLDQNGQIVDSSGRIIAGQNGPITVPRSVALSQINVSSDGTIRANGVEIDKFRIVSFGEDENKLIPVGGNCFKAPEDVEPEAAENVVVRQGYLESSNVRIIDELVDMMLVSRLYEANMKFMTAKKEAGDSLMNVAMG